MSTQYVLSGRWNRRGAGTFGAMAARSPNLASCLNRAVVIDTARPNRGMFPPWT